VRPPWAAEPPTETARWTGWGRWRAVSSLISPASRARPGPAGPRFYPFRNGRVNAGRAGADWLTSTLAQVGLQLGQLGRLQPGLRGEPRLSQYCFALLLNRANGAL